MMNLRLTHKNLNWILILIIVIQLIGIIFLVKRPKVDVPANEMVDSLRNLNSNSITIIDSSKKELIKLNEGYEKDFNIILNQSVDSDLWVFSNYLSIINPAGLISGNNKDSIKSN